MFSFGGDPDIRYDDKVFVEKKAIYANASFFKVFNRFKLIPGDGNNILNVPHQVVMTQLTAHKYFGDDDPIGKVVNVWQSSQSWEVVGAMEDVPQNSHFRFDMICSMVSIPLAQSTIRWDTKPLRLPEPIQP